MTTVCQGPPGELGTTLVTAAVREFLPQYVHRPHAIYIEMRVPWSKAPSVPNPIAGEGEEPA